MVIFAGVRGFLDKIAVKDVPRYEAELLRAFRQTHKKLLAQLAKEKSLSDESEAALTEFLTSFTKNFS